MNTKIYFIIFIIFITFSTVSSLEIKTSKDQFMQGETFQASISGNILQNIQKYNVGFYRNNVQEAVDFNIAKINNTYHIYAVLPYKTENYTLKIKNVYFKEQNSIKYQDLTKNFSILNQTAEFGVKPGFIITNKDFSINIHNNKDVGLAVVYTLENTSYSAMIPPQESRDLLILISSLSGGTKESLVLLSSGTFTYKIPVYVIKNTSEKNNSYPDNSSSIKYEKLDFVLAYLNETLKKGEFFEYNIELVNKGDKKTGKVAISVSDNLKEFITLNKSSFESINSMQVVNIGFSVKAMKSGTFSGFIYVSSDNSSDNIAINLKIGENLTSSTSLKINNTCAQLNGKKCEAGKFCSSNNIPSSDGFCCLGQCTSLQQESSSVKRNWIAVIIVVIILAFIGVFFWQRYKKPQLKDIIKEKSKVFEERFETRDKLSKS